MDTRNLLRENAIEFAIQLSDICENISGCAVYKNQVIRSSSSIGANIFEARYAQSKADFVSKLEIALKECYETEYWMELLLRKGKISQLQFQDLSGKCGSIRRRLIASVSTVKKSLQMTSEKEVNQ